MKKLLTVFILGLFLVMSCETFKDIRKPCNVIDPLTELPWLAEKMVTYKVYKSSIIIDLITYKGQQFIQVINVVSSATPAGSTFDCQGNDLIKLGIDYKDFTKRSRKIKTLRSS